MGITCNFLFSKREIEKFVKIFIAFLTLARIKMCDCQMPLVPQNIKVQVIGGGMILLDLSSLFWNNSVC